MGRTKKVSTESKLALVDEYCLNVARGEFRLMKFEKIAVYAQKKGMDLKEYVFRNDTVVRDHVLGLKSGEVTLPNLVFPYEPMDIQKVLQKGVDVSQVKALLEEMDEKCCRLFTSRSELWRERDELRHSLDEARQEIVLLKSQVRTTACTDDRKLQELREENAALRRFMKEQVSPEIAADLLSKRGIMVEHGHVLKPESGFYEGKEPMPLPSQGSSPMPAAGTDDLIQQLRAVSDQHKNGGLTE